MNMLATNEVRSKPKPEKVLNVKKRRPKTERKILEGKLDALVREIVLDRDVNCVCPPPQRGHYGAMQAGHLVTRGKESIRWSLLNVHVQCQSCNARHNHFPHYYTNWFLEKFGRICYSLLCQDAEAVRKLQLYELQELYDQMKKIRQKQLQSILMGEIYKPYFTQAEILSGAWDK